MKKEAAHSARLGARAWPQLGTHVRPLIAVCYALAEAHIAHARLEAGDVGWDVRLPDVAGHTTDRRHSAGTASFYLADASTSNVELPWARMRPSAASTRASAVMICRPWLITRPSARTRPVSALIGREKLPLVSTVV